MLSVSQVRLEELGRIEVMNLKPRIGYQSQRDGLRPLFFGTTVLMESQMVLPNGLKNRLLTFMIRHKPNFVEYGFRTLKVDE